MSNEEKIKELEERVAKLEKIERDRKTRAIIKICFKIICFIVIVIMCYKLYLYIKPYVQKVDEFKEFEDNLNIRNGSLSDFDLNKYLDYLNPNGN